MVQSDIYVIIGCEESQATTKELRKLGVNAYSCDLKECTGGHPEWHIKGDMFKAVNGGLITLQNGETILIIKWSFGIFHPPCTFLSGSGCQWMSHPEDKHLPLFDRREHPLPKHKGRRYNMLDAVSFVKKIYVCMDSLVIENPTGLLSSRWMKPTQIVQPYFFGDEATKTTCLWLKNMPKLKPTNIVGKGKRVIFESGKSHPEWYAAARGLSQEERQTLRSKTFPGMAQAMAQQWTDFILNSPIENTLFNLEHK